MDQNSWTFDGWKLKVRQAFEKAGLDIILIAEDEAKLFECGHQPDEVVNMYTPDTEEAEAEKEQE